jgi:P27 family predicted phage terminase small subunit
LTKGRKRKPTALKLVANNPGKRPLNKREPKPKGGPIAPAELNARAKREWNRICKALDGLGLLTGADTAILALYCAAYATWCQAQRELNKKGAGPVIKAANKTLIPSPWLAVSNRAHDQIVKVGAELGLTPSARARLQVPPADDPGADDWSDLD